VNSRRLYRSSTDRWIGGVAAGVADYFDIDPLVVRILWIVVAIFTALIPAAIVYIVMLIVVPEEPADWPQPSPWQPGGAPLGYGAAFVPPANPANPADSTAAPAAAPGPTDAPGAGAQGPAPAAAPGQVPPAQGWDWRWAARQDRWQRRAERWQRRADHWEARAEGRNSGALVFGVLLIVVGGLLAWHQVNPNLDLGLAWPVAAIAFGAFLVATSFGFGRND
jgi:phage shock protein C